MKNEIVTIFGGSGFVGRYIVKRFAEAGYRVRIAVRRPERADFLKPAGRVGQIITVQANIRDPHSVARAVEGATIVINAVGVLFESGKQNFDLLHHQGAETVAKAAKAAGAKRFLHLSAIGADENSASQYAASKGLGEKAVTAAFSEASIIRPSVVFGAEDNFFNRFAKMSFFSPFLPAVGGGETKMQPVYVNDVAEAVFKAAHASESAGKIYELGGPSILTFREILEKTCYHIGRKRFLFPLPFWFARIKAFFFEFLPNPPLTRDQVTLLEKDNIVSENALNFQDLEISPQDLDPVLEDYMRRYRPGGFYNIKKGYTEPPVREN